MSTLSFLEKARAFQNGAPVHSVVSALQSTDVRASTEEEKKAVKMHQAIKTAVEDLQEGVKAASKEIVEKRKGYITTLENYMRYTRQGATCVPLSNEVKGRKYLRQCEATRTGAVSEKIVEQSFPNAITADGLREAHMVLVAQANKELELAQKNSQAHYAKQIKKNLDNVKITLAGLSDKTIAAERSKEKKRLEALHSQQPDFEEVTQAKQNVIDIENQAPLIDVIAQALQSSMRLAVTKTVEKVEISQSKTRSYKADTPPVSPEIQKVVEELDASAAELKNSLILVADLPQKIARFEALLEAKFDRQKSGEEIYKDIITQANDRMAELRREIADIQGMDGATEKNFAVLSSDNVEAVTFSAVVSNEDEDEDDDDEDKPATSSDVLSKSSNTTQVSRVATKHAMRVTGSASPFRLKTIQPVVSETLQKLIPQTAVYTPGQPNEILKDPKFMKDVIFRTTLAMREHREQNTKRVIVPVVRITTVNPKNVSTPSTNSSSVKKEQGETFTNTMANSDSSKKTSKRKRDD